MRLAVSHENNTPSKHSYTTTEYALSDPELRAEVIAQALRELSAFRRKYAELNELLPIFAIIDKIRRKVSKAA